MIEEKTLVEQLREARTCSHFASKTGVFACNKLLSYLADRIEAEYTPNSVVESDYIPAPRDKNGKIYNEPFDVFINCKKTNHNSLIYNLVEKAWCIKPDEEPIMARRASLCEIVEPPKQLTKEDIDAMAKTYWARYWNCSTIRCNSMAHNCPSTIDGKTPKDYYGVDSCMIAKSCDIVRKERERVAGKQKED